MLTTQRSEGVYLLEFAVAVPILLSLTLGLIDLSRYWQAKQAVNTAAQAALRCLYPSDGDCTNPGRSDDARSDLFNWYFIPGQPVWNVSTYQYRGKLTQFVRNVLEYNPQVTVLGNMNYQIARSYQTSAGVSWKGQHPYWRRIRGFPVISGSDPRNPRFSFPANRTIVVNGEATVAPGQTKSITSASFIIKKPIKNDPYRDFRDCFEKIRGKAAYLGRRCAKGWPPGFEIRAAQELQRHTFVLLWVRGLGRSGSSLTHGQVNMVLEKEVGGSWRHERSLGGQGFTTPYLSPLNFWVRGAPGKGGSKQFPEYLSGFHSAIKIEFGRKYRLRFPISHNHGSDPVTYRVSDINIWYPTYESRDNRWKDCERLFPANESANPQNCAHRPSYIDFRPEYGPHDFGRFCTETPDEAVSLALAEADRQGHALSAADFDVEITGPCSGSTHTVICPRGGVDGNWSFANLSDEERASICLGDHSHLELYHSQIFTPKVVDLGSVQLLEECGQVYPNRAEYPQWQRFQEFQWGEARVVEHRFESRPDPNLCVRQQTIHLPDFLALEEIPPDSLFRAGTIDLGCGWQQRLANEARRILQIPDSVPLVFEGDNSRRDGIASLTSRPVDTCTNYSVQIKSYASPILVSGGPWPHGFEPELCRHSDRHCFAEFAGYQSGLAPDPSELNIELARERADQALNAIIPSAGSGCLGPNCSSIEIWYDQATVTAKVKLELSFLLLGNRTVSVSSVIEEAREQRYAD